MTLERIAGACLHAARYDPSRDPGILYRKDLVRQRERLSQLERAAHVLAKACERRDKALIWCLPGGLNSLEVRLSRPHDGRRVDILDMGAAWFSELEEKLKGEFPELHGGPWLHRFTVGNLHFDKPVQAGRPIDVCTMLAFELTIYLRMLTAGKGHYIRSTGQRMPDCGKPCGHVVALFCNATLGTRLDTRRVADRLRKLGRGVKWIQWPEVE